MTAQRAGTAIFDGFSQTLAKGGHDGLRAGVIGKDVIINGPFGPKPMIYADYVASGRPLMQVEEFMLHRVLPTYANTHTEASHSGAETTRLREGARAVIAAACGADDDFAVVFAGSGATAGLNRLVTLCGVPQAVAAGRPVRILHGPYEHHSNILPWRESGAEVIEIAECDTGGPCPDALEAALASAPRGALLVGAFSAASNVTGLVTDVAKITAILNRHGARAIWDYAGGGPYLPIAMRPAPGVTIDAISISPHKFLGGPGASGVMVIRRAVCVADRPSWPGGGTVTYVSPTMTRYSTRIEDREEAGTPNILGDIRAGLAFLVKDAIGAAFLATRQAALTARGLAFFRDQPDLHLLGPASHPRLPIFSCLFTGQDGKPVHYQFAARLLSDKYGVQARGGCACAGPYAHRLLGFDATDEARILSAIDDGRELDRPGFVRINLSVLMPDTEIDTILGALAAIPRDAVAEARRYVADPATALFSPAPPLDEARPPRRWRALWPFRAT